MAIDTSLDSINAKLAKAVGYVDKLEKGSTKISTNAKAFDKGVTGLSGGTGGVGKGGGMGLGLANVSTPAPTTTTGSTSSTGGQQSGSNNLMAGSLAVVGGGAAAAWSMTPGARDYAASQAALFPTAFNMAGAYSNQRAAGMIQRGIGQGSSGIYDAKAAAAYGSNTGLSFNVGSASGGTALGNALGTAAFNYQFSGMGNAASMQGSVNMVKGTSGVSSTLAKIGIFTADMNSGKPKDMAQIVDELWVRFYGSKSAKITQEQFDADLLMGFLGSDLNAMFGEGSPTYQQVVNIMRVKVRAGGRAGMRVGQTSGPNSVAQVAQGLGMNQFNTPTMKAGEVNSLRNSLLDTGSASGMQGYVTGMDAVANVDKGMQAVADTLPGVVEGLTTFKTMLDTFGSSGEGSGIMGFLGGLTKLLPGMAMGGTSTSDSINARLSKGEYVINARAAQQIGKDKLDALNSSGHSFGSAYASPVRNFAGGGTTVGGNPILHSGNSELGSFGTAGGNITVANVAGPLFQQLLSAWAANPLLGGGRYPLTKGSGVQSYNDRAARSGQGWSDHAGWAIDVRPDLLPDDNTKHMTAEETAAVHSILATLGGKIGWGGDYGKQEFWDEMHFFFNSDGSASTGTGSTGAAPAAAGAAAKALAVIKKSSPGAPSTMNYQYSAIMGTNLAGMGKPGSSIGSFGSGIGINAGTAGNNVRALASQIKSTLLTSNQIDPTGGASTGQSGITAPTEGASKPGVAASKSDLIGYLRAAGFGGEHLREAWAIAMRESTGDPTAHNIGPKDDSYGLFQINFKPVGGLDPAKREASLRQYVPGYTNRDSLFDPMVSARAAYYMSAKGTNWAPSWVGPHYGKADMYYNQYAEGASSGRSSTHAGTYNLHEGETIIPASEAGDFRAALREALSGGKSAKTVNVHLHIERTSHEEAVRFAKEVKGLIENDERSERMASR